MINHYSTSSKMNGYSTNDIIRNLFDLLAFQYRQHELQFVRVDEKFDVVRQLSYRGTGSKNE